MCKEMWLQAYECTAENIMEEKDVEYEEARHILDKIIEVEGDSLVCEYWYSLAECWEV